MTTVSKTQVLPCLDCGEDTSDEYFSLRDELWCEALLEEPQLGAALDLLERFEALSRFRGLGAEAEELDAVIHSYCSLTDGFLSSAVWRPGSIES